MSDGYVVLSPYLLLLLLLLLHCHHLTHSLFFSFCSTFPSSSSGVGATITRNSMHRHMLISAVTTAPSRRWREIIKGGRHPLTCGTGYDVLKMKFLDMSQDDCVPVLVGMLSVP